MSAQAPVIVLIEDEPNLVTMYHVAFRTSGFGLLTAVDAKQGLDMIAHEKPDLVLLDIIIPKEQGKVVEFDKRIGFEVLKEIKNNPETKHIPVITLTNLDSPEDRKRSQELGALDYIIKANVLPREVVDRAKSAQGRGSRRVQNILLRE